MIARRPYGAQIWNPLHLGGDASCGYWLTRESILQALKFFGCANIVVGQEQPDHAAGPAFALVAQRAMG